MKVVVTGQVGLDKKEFLEQCQAHAKSQGFKLKTCNVGDMMYAEAPDVAKGKILDLPIGRLDNLRRSVFKDVISEANTGQNIIVNTHATFRWNHGLFFAFDHDQMAQLDADLYIVLLDDIDNIYSRLVRDGYNDFTLKDLMVWREEEMLATELLSKIVRGHGHFYICVRGGQQLAETLVRLMFRPDMKKTYLSFPMSHVMDMPEVLEEIKNFCDEMKRHMICFDPADMESEKPLTFRAIEAAKNGQRYMKAGPANHEVDIDVQELLGIIPDIDGQIYVRDFKLIDQADMIISLIPELPDGKPAISSGVERELQHAHESTRDVFVIWQPKCEPSPFITETATKVFRSTNQAIEYFKKVGIIKARKIGGLFK